MNKSFALTTSLLAGVLAACSGTPSSTFGENVPEQGASAQNPGGPLAPPGSSQDPIGTNAACVEAVKNASLPAVNLIIMYDKSGSMGNPEQGGDPSKKWVPVNAGMKAFFSDKASAGYSASLQFFPSDGDLAAVCAADYETPLVPLTPLASNAKLLSALDDATPFGGTPTLPALQGAIAHAQEVAKTRPEEKSVVVLVSDGEPGFYDDVTKTIIPGCTDNDISHVANAAKAGVASTPSIPTYVIGVGTSLTNLEAIAKAGGTKKAFLVSVSDPAKTRLELQRAFEQIRSQEKISCAFGIPSAPPGKTLNTDRINVAIAPATGAETPLVYSKDCSANNGWRYDNADSPTRIELCPTTCQSVQQDVNSKIKVAMGCMTDVQLR